MFILRLNLRKGNSNPENGTFNISDV